MKTPFYANFEFLRKLMGGAYVRLQESSGSVPTLRWAPVVLLEDGSFYFADESVEEAMDIGCSFIEELRVYS